MVEDDDVFGADCWNRTVFLNLSGCSSSAASDPLLPIWMSLIMFSSCLVSPDVTRQRRPHVDLPSAPQPRFQVFHRNIPLHLAQRDFFSSLSLALDSATLSLHAFILAFSVKVLSIIFLIRSRQSLLCGFLIALPCDASAAQPGQPHSVTASLDVSRQDAESSGFEPLEFFPPQSLAMVVPLLLCQQL